MNELVKLLDPDLTYMGYEMKNNMFYISVISERIDSPCPFCGRHSNKTHSVYKRTFQDLPIQGKKVWIVLKNRKMFCMNSECTCVIFAERFDCLPNYSKKTKRLEEEIINISIHCSSVAAAEALNKNTVDIGKSTICNLLKKKRHSV